MNDKTKEKLNRLQDLIKQKDVIEKEIEAILAPGKVIVSPPGFSINSEVLSLIKGSSSREMASSSILNALQQKYPDYGIDRKKVASSLAYLKNGKKQIAQTERGVYKLIENQ